MSEVTISNSPFHVQARITRVYGYRTTSYTCGYHTGVDIVPNTNDYTEYSVCNGEVTNVINSTTQALGTQVQIYDTDRGIYWRYCHMVLNSPKVTIGQTVTIGTELGTMGDTGNVSGAHLHLEASTGASWVCGQFLNPCDLLGIPNEVGTIINYGGTPPPPPPPPPTLEWIYKESALNQSEMENNATIVIDYYRSQGINDYTIAAILGNMQAESTIEPWRRETGGQGYGLVQWTPESVLINHCNILGYEDATNGDTQLKVIVREIQGNPASVKEWYTTSAFINNYTSSGATSDMIGVTGNEFLSNTMGWDEQKLAIMFMVGYERPNYDPSINHVEFRKQCATAWLQFMGGVVPPTPVPPTPPPPSTYEEKEGFPWAVMTNKIRDRRKGKNG